MKKEIVAIIPARMGSSRFPGKPLADIAGLAMIEHVRRRVLLSDAIDDAVVATCDQEILDVVLAAGGKAVMTANTHERCTDRVAEAVEVVRDLSMDVVVIVQGDEPLLNPHVLTPLVAPFTADESVACTNLLSLINDPQDLDNVDIVKAEIKLNQDVLSFSRAPIPYLRHGESRLMYRQTGISAFTRDFLLEFTALAATPLEIAESVDFLRILEHNHSIRSVIYNERTVGVDRFDDVAIVENILQKDGEQKIIFERIIG